MLVVNCPDSKVIFDELPEVCKVKLVFTSISNVSNDIFDRFSRWMPLTYPTVWMHRFMFKTKIYSSEEKHRQSSSLSVLELKTDKIWWVQNSQRSTFASKYKNLSEIQVISGKIKLKIFYRYEQIYPSWWPSRKIYPTSCAKASVIHLFKSQSN